MKGFLDYSAGNSFIHRLDPLTKLLLSVGLCAGCFISSSFTVLLGILFIDIIIGFAGGIAGRTFKMLFGLIKISVILFIVQLIFIRSGNVLLSLPLGMTITDNALIQGGLLVLRLISATLPLALLLSLTKISDLSNVLCKKLFIPYKYAFTLTTAIKFIPVFAEEMSAIIESQTARGVDFSTKNPFKKIGLILPLCIPLLVSSVKKIDSSSVAAQMRGFHLRTGKSSVKNYQLKFMDYAAMTFTIFIIVSAVII